LCFRPLFLGGNYGGELVKPLGDEQIALVVHGDEVWGIEGERRDAEVIDGRKARRAADKVRDAYDSESLSVVEIDKASSNRGINLVAEGDDGEGVRIVVADGQLVFHADDGEDAISFSLGSRDVDADADASVNIRARESNGDEGGVVVIRGATEEDVHEFIDDLDDIPRSVKRELLKEIGL